MDGWTDGGGDCEGGVHARMRIQPVNRYVHMMVWACWCGHIGVGMWVWAREGDARSCLLIQAEHDDLRVWAVGRVSACPHLLRPHYPPSPIPSSLETTSSTICCCFMSPYGRPMVNSSHMDALATAPFHPPIWRTSYTTCCCFMSPYGRPMVNSSHMDALFHPPPRFRAPAPPSAAASFRRTAVPW
eukprot:360384-Chlamydomonas_euryale.AAC.1